MAMKERSVVKMIALICLCLAVVGAAGILGLNLWVTGTASGRILTTQEAAQLQDMDCILVLGCQVKDDGVPSTMLADRLKRGVELYRVGAAPKLLMSGDHGTQGYNEVGTMKAYAIDAGIAGEDIFMDHAGFSTYESMVRAKEVFQAKKILIVTQEYHLYRAIFIARQLGLEAYGVAAEYQTYGGQLGRDVREVLARCKDVMTTVLGVEPTYGGDVIPISGDGNLTND